MATKMDDAIYNIKVFTDDNTFMSNTTNYVFSIIIFDSNNNKR